MTIRKFPKLDWRKIIIFTILFMVSSIFALALSTIYIFCAPVVDCPSDMVDWGVFTMLSIISFIISYFLSCLIVWIYDKVKKKSDTDVRTIHK